MAIDLSVLEKVPEDVERHIPMMVAHFGHVELENMDKTQGGASVDEATGLREYSKYWDIIKQPKMKAMIKKMGNIEQNKIEPQDSAMKGFEKLVPQKHEQFIPSPADSNPEVQKLEAEGTDGDDELALIPVPMANFFDSVRGEPETNKHTGLPQYWGLKRIIRDLSNLGGPITGAIGSVLTGQNWKVGAKRGIKWSLATMAAAAAAAAAPALLAAGSAGMGSLGSMMGMGGAGAGTGAAAGTAAAGTAAAGTGAVASGTAAAAPGFFSSMMSSPWVLPLAAVGMMAKGNKQYKQDERKAQEDLDAQNRRGRLLSGADLKIGTVKNFKDLPARDFRSPEERMNSSYEFKHYRDKPAPYYTEYAKGGHVPADRGLAKMRELKAKNHSRPINGPGRGQEDRVPAQLKEGDYVMDASTTSDLGDGYSGAGHAALADMVKKLHAKHPLPKVSLAKGGKILDLDKSRIIPAALSPGEHIIDRRTVTIIGNGSNDKGANMLDIMRKNLRKHKNSNGTELPPKAKHIEAYFPKQFKLMVG